MSDPYAWIERRETSDVNYNRATYFMEKAEKRPLYAFDCSGLIVHYISDIKHWMKGDTNAQGLYRMCGENRGYAGKTPMLAGDLVFKYSESSKKMVHVGVYVGDGYTIEAKGRDDGVCKRKLSDGNWTHWGRLALLQQEEKEAHHVATALEIYVKGSLNLFNHRTNVNVNNRIVCYDIKELGKQMKKLGMLIVQDQVWGRVTANRSSGKSTRYYMDEMHLLLKEEQTAAYSVEIWKRFRKWGGIPTGLTQNVKDLLSSREVENIFENSDMIIMLNQAAGDRQILAKQLNISPHQLSYVTHSGEGEGLLFFGNVILPFVDRFPTDLELYRIMTTKLGEVSEGAQK